MSSSAKNSLSAAAAYNKKAKPGERVTQYEIEVWNWDFRGHPFDPNYGNLMDRFVFELNTGLALRQGELDVRSSTDSTAPLKPDSTKGGDGVAR
jgi:hypothetical protein